MCRNKEIKTPGLNILDQEGDCLVEGELAATLGSLGWEVRPENCGQGLELQEENQANLYFFGSAHLQKNENLSPYLNLGHFIEVFLIVFVTSEFRGSIIS